MEDPAIHVIPPQGSRMDEIISDAYPTIWEDRRDGADGMSRTLNDLDV
jgi:hypothetical protein